MVKQHKPVVGRRLTDLTGRRFGRLVAEYPTEKRDHKGSVYWHCRCDCGKEAEVTEDGLIFGNNLSCGCLKQENQQKVSEQLHRIDGTCVEWLEKRKNRSDNKSGFRGVYRLKNGKYRAKIGFKGQQFYLGTFDTFDIAVQARRKAEKDIHEEFVKQYYVWKKRADADPEWGKRNPLVFQVIRGKGGMYHVICEKGTV
ncbi:MAG TPA: hypothetical protein H9717_13440 [Candidatus Eisenbergiella merdipullorum]|uniref:AP2/ERF domain-containing protein n=1 Tax=Candidatus Eisenbergiella merdipullorum TaxID=2838553 RepID=A0A9D2I9A2_9FIRM|nr:hypothetical protein [Candidatus Eisenbergiella merdipullorum]